MKEINGKVIVLGDTHFGLSKFSISVLQNQLKLFKEQILPYMKENNIFTIIQLGDLFDNRTTTDINFMTELRIGFFDLLKENNIQLHALVGNHDIYRRESREITLVKFYRDLYPDNFTLYEHREEIIINGNRTYMVPWITKDETLSLDEIRDMHSVLGHFEIRDFQLSKGIRDENSRLTRDFFENGTSIKNVFSGHYHLKDSSGIINYLGTPFWFNWGDSGEVKGFYVWDEFDSLEFIENTSTKRYIKIKYNDSNDSPIVIQGLYQNDVYTNHDGLKDIMSELEKHEVKFLINEAKDRKFDESLYEMKESKINCTIINNQEINLLIDSNVESGTSIDFIKDTVKEHANHLTPLMLDILEEIQSKGNI